MKFPSKYNLQFIWFIPAVIILIVISYPFNLIMDKIDNIRWNRAIENLKKEFK